MVEIWKDIVEYEGLYQISNFGIIKSLKRNTTNGGILKLYKHSNGYLGGVLFKNGIRKDFLVHRLVLETFIGSCPPGMESCHNNGLRDNNKLTNLRYDTRKNNCEDRRKHGNERNQNGIKNNMVKLNDNKIIEIRKLHTRGKSNKEISKMFNVSSPNISLIINYKRWKHIKEGM